MIYIYYCDFKIQAEILVVFNIIRHYSTKISIFSVIYIRLLIRLNIIPCFKLSAYFQLSPYFPSPLCLRWWKDISWTHNSHEINEGCYNPEFLTSLVYIHNWVLPSYINFVWWLLICACYFFSTWHSSPMIICMWKSYGYHKYS